MGKQVLMLVAGFFAFKREEIQIISLKMQSQIHKCRKEKNLSVLVDDKLARNQCCVCYREVKTY